MPNSGLRIACLIRSSPEATSPESCRLLARSPIGLVLDPAAVFWLIELFAGELPELLVGLEQLHLAVAYQKRLPMPLAELLRDPDGVLFGVEHPERVGRRIDSRAPRQIIFHEQPHVHRLRLNSQRFGRERAGDIERIFLVAAGRENPLALSRRARNGRFDALPLQPDVFDPEIILRPYLEAELLGVEDNLLTGQVLAGNGRGFVLAAGDR